MNTPSSSSSPPNYTQNIVRPFGYSGVECGYCKGARSNLVGKSPQESSKSYGLLVDSMTPSTYEAFLARGWRRSGIHLYKPCNFESCCPTITIRLLAPQFQKTKSQHKVWNKMNNLLLLMKGVPPNKTKKKKKRNKSNNDNKNTSNHPTPMCMDATGTDDSNSTATAPPPKTTEQAVHESGVLTQLETCIQQALTATLPEYNNNNNASSSSLEKDHPKVVLKFQKPSKQHKRQGQIQLSTSICAQVAGKLKLSSRGDLVQTVVSHLLQQKSATILQATKSGVAIKSIQPHPPSGQIIVTLQLLLPSDNYNNHNATNGSSSSSNNNKAKEVDDMDASMTDVSKPNNNDPLQQQQETTTVTDKLGQWYLQHTGKPLAEQDRILQVTTLPAHESALMPETHKLYAEYQHVVHNDPDPFVVNHNATSSSTKKDATKSVAAPSPPSAATDNTTTASTTTTTQPQQQQDTMANENETFSSLPSSSENPQQASNDDDNNNNNTNTVATSSSVADTDDDEGGEDEEEEPPVDMDQLDWGNAPDYFKSQVKPMLQRYTQDYMDETIRNNILSNYYSYYQFLVESPFPVQHQQQNGKGQPQNLICGTYHQHYKIGNVLIAVGVVDLLPHGLSSVYLYYLPSFSHDLVALGKYAILKEVEYTQTTQKPYYYLGYYIQSCPKMRYKGDYHPSELLCPVHYEWVNAKEAVAKIQATSPRDVCELYSNSDDKNNNNKKDDKTCNPLDESSSKKVMNELYLDIGAGINITLPMLQESGQEVVQPILEDFLQEAGPELAKQCLLKLT